MKSFIRCATARSQNRRGHSENGMALLLSLAMLAGLSLLALLAANSMLQQQQMTSNFVDGELARASALVALARGEQSIFSLPLGARMDNCQSACFADTSYPRIHDADEFADSPDSQPDSWWQQFGLTEEGEQTYAWNLSARQPPLFLIQEIVFLPAGTVDQPAEQATIQGIAYYQVLGRGTGRGENSTHIAESIVARPWLEPSTTETSEPIDCSVMQAWYDCGRMAYRERR